MGGGRVHLNVWGLILLPRFSVGLWSWFCKLFLDICHKRPLTCTLWGTSGVCQYFSYIFKSYLVLRSTTHTYNESLLGCIFLSFQLSQEIDEKWNKPHWHFYNLQGKKKNIVFLGGEKGVKGNSTAMPFCVPLPDVQHSRELRWSNAWKSEVRRQFQSNEWDFCF